MTVSHKYKFLHQKKNYEIQPTTETVLRIASIALQTLRSRTRASAELWNVRPNRLLPVHQWWKVGFAFVYCRSFFNGQFSTTWDKNNRPPYSITHREQYWMTKWHKVNHIKLAKKQRCTFSLLRWVCIWHPFWNTEYHTILLTFFTQKANQFK